MISETEYEAICKRYKIATTFFKNEPLGEKKNHGLQVAMRRKWDFLMELNSDDLIKDELIDVYLPYLLKGVDYIGIENFCFLDSETGELRQHASKTVYGIGRMYSRAAIMEAAKMQPIIARETAFGGFSIRGYMVEGDRLDVAPVYAEDLIQAKFASKNGGIKYKLWDDMAQSGMDNYSDKMMDRAGFKCKSIFTDDPLAVDIKSRVNIWKFNKAAGQPYDLEEFLKGFSDDERVMVLNLLRKENVEYS